MTNTSITYRKSLLFMEDADLCRVAEKYGTPLYCYSAARITEKFRRYDDAMKRVADPKNYTICYATKANSNVAVLSLLQKLGAGADIVSGGEMQRALKAGIDPKKIVFSGVGKSEEELEAAIRRGILQINVESEEELKTISRLSKKAGKTTRIAIRVNPDVDAKTHAKITTGKKENKFGIDIKDAPALYKKAAKLPGIDPSGVAVHIGSQLVSLTPFRRAYERVAELLLRLRKSGIPVTRVDLGGGIGITYRDEKLPDMNLYALMVRDIILPLNVHVILEPGRSIVGDAGVLLSRVRHIKNGHDKKFLILDAAMNDLMRPALYDAYHTIVPCRKTGGRKQVYDVVGPVCESGDTFLTGEAMPEMTEGDVVAIMCAGAYGAVMSSNYNTRPNAAEILVSGSRTAVIRPRQTVDELIARDKVPVWV
jgi:diaminopimelate decarboxylase